MGAVCCQQQGNPVDQLSNAPDNGAFATRPISDQLQTAKKTPHKGKGKIEEASDTAREQRVADQLMQQEARVRMQLLQQQEAYAAAEGSSASTQRLSETSNASSGDWYDASVASKVKKRRMILTGKTLEAALKMRCDMSGAVYSIYWCKVDDVFVVAGSYVTPDCRSSMKMKRKDDRTFADTCAELKLDSKSLIHQVSITREAAFIQDAGNCHAFPRELIAREFDVKSVCIIPFEDGVLEYGTGATWKKAPECHKLPLDEVQLAFEHHGASYVLLWVLRGKLFVVTAEYACSSRLKSLKNRRGDDKTYNTESRLVKLGPDSIVGKLVATQKIGSHRYLENVDTDASFDRMKVAKEFGVKSVRMSLCKGGVLEYAIPAEEQLAGNTLAATLKMTCDLTGAVYAIYWVGVDGEFVVAGDYVTPDRITEMKSRRGDNRTFAGTCSKLKLGYKSLVAKVASTGEERFVEGAASSSAFPRGHLAAEFGINSITLMPVTGGVLEFGTGAKWTKIPEHPMLPKAELKEAFDIFGAVYTILWLKKNGKFVVMSDFVTPEREEALRNVRGDNDTYPTKCREMMLGDDSVISKVYRSRVALSINDADVSETYERMALAKEFGVKCVRIIPCGEIVLEYGLAVIPVKDEGVANAVSQDKPIK